MQAAQPNPSWMRVVSTTQLPAVSTEITVGGVYLFNAGSGAVCQVQISGSAIGSVPNAATAAFTLGAGQSTWAQYVAAGQFIRCDSSSGTFSLLQ